MSNFCNKDNNKDLMPIHFPFLVIESVIKVYAVNNYIYQNINISEKEG